jgi:hypothetical protein
MHHRHTTLISGHIQLAFPVNSQLHHFRRLSHASEFIISSHLPSPIVKQFFKIGRLSAKVKLTTHKASTSRMPAIGLTSW